METHIESKASGAKRQSNSRLRVSVKPEMLQWARDRAMLPAEELAAKFPKLPEWESGEASPTLKQLESFAKATYAPLGFLLLPEPPVEPLPIPDFRTIGDKPLRRPSPNLLDTIYICQQRQNWYREFLITAGEPLPAFVGSLSIGSDVEVAAKAIGDALHFDVEARRSCATWSEALRLFISHADAAGVLVMCSGVVGSNNSRKLDPKEFRGFALSDEVAPLVFVNGSDSKAAQMFTLAHELAHIWLGRTALSDASITVEPSNEVEQWCNRVAAEMLVPREFALKFVGGAQTTNDAATMLARACKVSTLVALRRLRDIGYLDQEGFRTTYNQELERIMSLPKGSGGDFYLTTAARVSKRFARALVSSTLEGRTLYRDAFRLLGISKTETFEELGRSLKFSV